MSKVAWFSPLQYLGDKSIHSFRGMTARAIRTKYGMEENLCDVTGHK